MMKVRTVYYSVQSQRHPADYKNYSLKRKIPPICLQTMNTDTDLIKASRTDLKV